MANICMDWCRESLNVAKNQFGAEARSFGIIGFFVGLILAGIGVWMYVEAKKRREKGGK